MKGKFMKNAGKVARGLVGAGAIGLASQASAFDSNIYFRITPVDSVPDIPGIQWIIGSSNNYVNVEMRTGSNININITGIDLRYRDPDFTTNGFLIRNASMPASTNLSDIFYGKVMSATDLLSTNNSGISTRLINSGQSGVPANTFTNNNYGLYGTWQLELASWLTNSYKLTNAGRLVGSGFTINTDDPNFPNQVYPSSFVSVETSPLFDEVKFVPEPSTGGLIGLGAVALAASSRRRNQNLKERVRDSQVPNGNSNRMYRNNGCRRS